MATPQTIAQTLLREIVSGKIKTSEALFDALVRETLPAYKQRVARHDATLEKYGRETVLAVVKKLRAPASPTPDWLDKLADPVLTPFVRGVRSEALKAAAPHLVGLGLGAVGFACLLFFLGRASKKCLTTANK